MTEANPPLPQVAIVIPCFEDGRWVEEAYRSAARVGQEVSEIADLRIVIVDDGCVDPRTISILDRIQRSGGTVLRILHAGLGGARNAGISYARCPFFIPLDADNVLRPEMVREGLPILLATPAAAIAYGDAVRFGTRHDRWVMGPTDEALLKTINHIDNCALIRTAAWEAVDGYAHDRLGLEDWDLWMKLLAAGWTLEYTGVPSFDYRVRPQSLVQVVVQPRFSLR
jgi:glycosyltransferase involved in cell wall biosynthesis